MSGFCAVCSFVLVDASTPTSTGGSIANTTRSIRTRRWPTSATPSKFVARHLISAARPLIEAGILVRRVQATDGAARLRRDQPAAGIRGSSRPRCSSAVTKIETFPASPTLEQIIALLADAKARLRCDPEPRLEPAADRRRCRRLCRRDRRAAVRAAADRLSRGRAHRGVQRARDAARHRRSRSVPPTATRPSYVRTHFRWEELPKVISSPARLAGARLWLGHAGLQRRPLRSNIWRPVPRAWTSRCASARRRSRSCAAISACPTCMLAAEPTSVELPFFYGHFAGQDLEAAFALRELPAQGERAARPRARAAHPVRDPAGARRCIPR